ncbi:MAG: ABC transporter ATP-binding protein [Bacteroidota bacterium]|nr:ABC transporter ATP-binding protein [Bacteroidota bacterium]
MIEAKNITLSYGEIKVLKGIDISIEKGDLISIVGASGAGKTTLLNILGTLEKSDSGSLIINNKNIHELSDKQLSLLRNSEIGFIFQFHNLLPEFTALENVYLPSLIGGKNKKESMKKATELLTLLKLKERLHHRPNELSGGEQQRVAVARALINEPSVILADEPTGNLDSKNASELHNLLIKLNKDLNQSFIIVTHNEELASMAHRKLEMKDGKIFSR